MGLFKKQKNNEIKIKNDSLNKMIANGDELFKTLYEGDGISIIADRDNLMVFDEKTHKTKEPRVSIIISYNDNESSFSMSKPMFNKFCSAIMEANKALNEQK